MTWQTPKINWAETDPVNITDFNRIRNNILIVMGLLSSLYGGLEISDMGDEMTSYADAYSVDAFNAIEDNIEVMGRYLTDYDVGYKMTFYPNGKFIKYTELNRIERITKQYENQVDAWLKGLTRLPKVLGRKDMGIFK